MLKTILLSTEDVYFLDILVVLNFIIFLSEILTVFIIKYTNHNIQNYTARSRGIFYTHTHNFCIEDTRKLFAI